MTSVFNDDDVLRLLEIVLAEPDPILARLCVQLAGYLGVPVASIAHRAALPSRATKTSAVNALVELCAYGCVDLALRLARHPNSTLRIAALESLEDVEDPRIAPALRSLPPDVDPEVQRTLGRVRASLDRLDVHRRVPRPPRLLTVSEARLARLLVGKVPDAEIPHARAMRSSDIAAVSESAQGYFDRRVNEVLATLKSSQTVEALTLLGTLQDSRAVPYLEEAGLSSDLAVGAAQINVLEHLGSEPAVSLLMNWLAAPLGFESLIWLALARSGDIAAPDVTRVLPTLDVERRIAIARIASARWPQPILFAFLNDPNVDVRLAAIEAILSGFDRRDFKIARMAVGLLAGVITRSNLQSDGDQRVAEAARLGMKTLAKVGFPDLVMEAFDTILETVDNATRDLLLEIREGMKPLCGDFDPCLASAACDFECAGESEDSDDEEERRHKVTDAVSFSVTSPLAIAPADIFSLGVWMHSDHQREEVLARAQREQGEAFRVVSRGPVQVARETLLTVQVRIPAFGTAAEDTIGWSGEIGHVAFLVTVPAGAPRGPVAGSLLVHVGALRISRLEFVLEVGSRARRVHRAKAIERRVRRGFASYASDDRDEVMGRIQGMLKIAPALDIFVDALSLRSGERWEERLKQEIAARDVLYLFWSLAASRSEMVDREWRWALQKRGLDFIDPVPLQPPTVIPPPAELASLHFSDWTLAFKK